MVLKQDLCFYPQFRNNRRGGTGLHLLSLDNERAGESTKGEATKGEKQKHKDRERNADWNSKEKNMHAVAARSGSRRFWCLHHARERKAAQHADFPITFRIRSSRSSWASIRAFKRIIA